MMKKRKFGSGGMPSIEESMKSGNRVSRQVGEETKRMMPPKKRTMPSIEESMKSGNRMSKENAKDAAAVKKYAKGGKIKKRYDEGGMATIASNPDEEMRKLMEANLAAVRRREAEEMASKAKPKPRASAPKPKPEPETEAPKPRAAAPKSLISKPASGMRVGSESASAAKNSLRSAARASGEAIKSTARGVGSAPSRVAKALESANDQTKMQARNMAKLREKNPSLVDRFMKMTMNPGMAKGGKVAKRADGIAKQGKTATKMVKMAKGKMR
jgi:hypothetical protein